MMKRFLFTLTKTWIGGALLGWALAHSSFLIPGEKMLETANLLAIHHPNPSYPLHILILPKGAYHSLQDLPTSDLAFERDLFQAVKELVRSLGLESRGYRLIVNGGKAQEVSHLHFHLISDHAGQKTAKDG
jgi:histidine triad (HIT) family protein